MCNKLADMDIFDLCDLVNKLWYFNVSHNLNISKDIYYQEAMAELKQRALNNYK